MDSGSGSTTKLGGQEGHPGGGQPEGCSAARTVVVVVAVELVMTQMHCVLDCPCLPATHSILYMTNAQYCSFVITQYIYRLFSHLNQK